MVGNKLAELRGKEDVKLVSITELLTLPPRDVLAQLGSSDQGLTGNEAERRLEYYGANEVAARKRRATAVEFLLQFRSPLILLLLFAGIVSLYFGEVIDSAIIFTIIIASASLDFYQQSKARQAAELLRSKLVSTCTTIREGVKREVKFTDVVPGDVLYFSAGDMIPADSRLLTAKDFFVNQSALTGESFPVEKSPSPLSEAGTSLTDWVNIVFTGSSVVSGTATAVVARTGGATEYGKIVKTLAARGEETEMERGLRQFGYLIMQVTLVLVIFVFFVNSLFGRGLLDSLLFSVALAVGLTPELLPMIISVNLSKGALAMSKRGVLVKRLSSIQNFGSMDILCTDKTGTLTENKITLVLHVDIEGREDNRVLEYSYLNSFYQTGLRSPLDEAILAFENVPILDYQKADEIPFDFVRRRVSIVVSRGSGRLLVTKGAPEEVLTICAHAEAAEGAVDLTESVKEKILTQYRDLSAQGFRVLGVSYRKLRNEKTSYSVGDENDMVFLGFVAFLDPPKQTAKDSLRLLNSVGVELKILTGDNELVTLHTCEQLGFKIRRVVLGSELAQLGEDALSHIVEEANVFARVNPSQKDRIMGALRRNSHVVGFLGDGINDAPSLKRADVGISVDNAVDVAKESADIILLQKDLTVLQNGVIEGRRTFGNTMKYIMMGTSSNFGNMFSVTGASLFLPFLPMLPTQILLNNLLYDLSQTTITTDRVDESYVERPKKMNIHFIRRFMVWFGPISSLFDFLTFFVMLWVFSATEGLFQTAWFLESLTTQTLVVFLIRTQAVPFWKSKPSRYLVATCLAILVFAYALPYTVLGALFGFMAPPPSFYPLLAALVATYLAMVEGVKLLFYRRYTRLLDQG
jgi:Mg2+-importing ATPase